MNGATTIQERLKDLRLNKGLKLEELAEQTGISKSALGSYEKDDFKEINHGNLILLADFYGVSLDYLFCRQLNRAKGCRDKVPAGVQRQRLWGGVLIWKVS